MLKIDWMESFGNDPRIYIEEDLDIHATNECEFTFKNGMWYHIQKNGIVQYLAHTGQNRNEGGFGGASFTILHNGEPLTLRGPWSGRASYLNMSLPANQQVADIYIDNGHRRVYTGMLISELVKRWDKPAYLLRKKSDGEAGGVTASLATDCILKRDGVRRAIGEYEIFAEPVNA